MFPPRQGVGSVSRHSSLSAEASSTCWNSYSLRGTCAATRQGVITISSHHPPLGTRPAVVNSVQSTCAISCDPNSNAEHLFMSHGGEPLRRIHSPIDLSPRNLGRICRLSEIF